MPFFRAGRNDHERAAAIAASSNAGGAIASAGRYEAWRRAGGRGFA
jgi:hypothetical protein